MARYHVANRGVDDLQTTTWTLTRAEAKAASGFLRMAKGSVWGRKLCSAGKAESITLYTSGFQSAELSNALYSAGCEMVEY